MTGSAGSSQPFSPFTAFCTGSGKDIFQVLLELHTTPSKSIPTRRHSPLLRITMNTPLYTMRTSTRYLRMLDHQEARDRGSTADMEILVRELEQAVMYNPMCRMNIRDIQERGEWMNMMGECSSLMPGIEEGLERGKHSVRFQKECVDRLAWRFGDICIRIC